MMARRLARWNASIVSVLSRGLKFAPMPMRRNLERLKPTQTKSSARLVAVALSSVRKRAAKASSVHLMMCATSLAARAWRSSGLMLRARSSVSTSSVWEFGLTRRVPQRTRAKPVNSESTQTPAGRLARWRASTNSSGVVLIASRSEVVSSASELHQSRSRSSGPNWSRTSKCTAPGKASLMRSTMVRISCSTAGAVWIWMRFLAPTHTCTRT
mmetsp:Transcript_48889/g.104370  ORF Transcript_48889/g.104370 Transcript_48889/m.104370 type:complete len:213 (-) Transcript_48889:891-1529(-)